MNILPELEAAYKLLHTIDARYNSEMDALKKCEDEENDIRHALELCNLNYNERAKLATKQVKVLQERRKHKDAVELMEPLYNLMREPEGVAFLKRLQATVGDVRKVSRNHKSRSYFYRTDAVKNTVGRSLV